MLKKGLVFAIVVLFVAVGFVPYISGDVGSNKDIIQINKTLDEPIIHGPHNGTVNVEYTFCTDPITDPQGDLSYCLWDWGDGTNTGWLGPYDSGQTNCASHSWTQAGVYEIKLKLKDVNGSESNWSDPFIITIVENHSPTDPIIDGPARGKVGVEYKCSLVSTDPDGDNITYYVGWGDQCGVTFWYGPYPSGEEIEIAHNYTYKYTFSINTMAIDEHGAESNMTYFQVSIPRIGLTPLFMRLLEQFPHAFPILKHLLKL